MSYLTEDDVVTRVYSGFRGVDFRGEGSNLTRSPDSVNMYKDYRETDSVRTRPGFKHIATTVGKPNSIYFYKGEMLVGVYGSGGGLFRYNEDGTAERLEYGNGKYQTFLFGDYLYFLGNAGYFYYDGETTTAVLGYVPTTSIARKPAGGGTIYEDVNMLTMQRINTFLADGESTEYHLDTQNINGVIEVTYNGNVVTNYTVDKKKGVVTFTSAPAAPATDGQDNVSIQFSKAATTNLRASIVSCTIVQAFDNRVFFSGNSNKPNTIWHCSLNDPSYISDLDYYVDGTDNTPIKAMVAGNNALWVFREPSDANTTVFYHTPTIDSDYGKIYPSQHSSVTTGCVGGAINFNDDIVFFSERGMEGISGDITTEQLLAHRSSLVDRKLIAEENYKDMILAEWDGYLMVFIDNHVYLADSRAVLTNESHTEYEWFYWELPFEVTCAKVYNGVLYVGTKKEVDGSYEYGIYALTDKEADVESYWVTPKDKFKYPHKLKTTNKRGCVVEATGDVSVYAKVEDTEFSMIGEYENIEDYFVCRIKQKKFKDIQLKFHSKTRFSLESLTLEAFVGGYIKR